MKKARHRWKRHGHRGEAQKAVNAWKYKQSHRIPGGKSIGYPEAAVEGAWPPGRGLNAWNTSKSIGHPEAAVEGAWPPGRGLTLRLFSAYIEAPKNEPRFKPPKRLNLRVPKKHQI